MVDRTLSTHDPDLASRAQVVDGLDVRLVLIDASQNVDEFCVLQGLADPSLESSDERYYSYICWGQTGTRGVCKLDGPKSLQEVRKVLERVFMDKTGSDWGNVKPGDRVPPGKFWPQHQAHMDLKARWEYYVGDGVDGKRSGWYPYKEDASQEVEVIYAQHLANKCEARTTTRTVQSGPFSYWVDLLALTQENTRTQKMRAIRRVLGVAPVFAGVKTRRGLGKAMLNAVMPRGPLEKYPMRKVALMEAASTMKTRTKVIKKTIKHKKSVMKKLLKEKAITKVVKAPKKRESTVAKGKLAKVLVFKGLKAKTSGGLTNTDLKRNTMGKIVSKKRSAKGEKDYAYLAKWIGACKQAKAELGLTGFVLMKKGTAYYEKAKALYPHAVPHFMGAKSSSLELQLESSQ